VAKRITSASPPEGAAALFGEQAQARAAAARMANVLTIFMAQAPGHVSGQTRRLSPEGNR